jgi:hypothetical protein
MTMPDDVLRTRLLEAGITRLDFAYCYYEDTTHVDDLRAFNAEGQEVTMDDALRHAVVSQDGGVSSYSWSSQHGHGGYGVYSWFVVPDTLVDAGAYQLTFPYEPDGSDVIYYSSPDRQAFVQAAIWTSAESSETIETLPDDPDVFSRRVLAQNPNTPTHLLARLAGDVDAQTRKDAQVHRFLPQRSVKSIENDLGMAFTTQIEPELLEILAQSQWSMVRQAVAKHPLLPQSSLERLAIDPIPQVRIFVLGNPNITEELRSKLLTDLKALPGHLRESIASDEQAPVMALEVRSTDWLMPVHVAVIHNRMTPSSFLFRFAMSSERELRNELLNWHGDKVEVVQALIDDPDDRIRNRVIAALAELPTSRAFDSIGLVPDEMPSDFKSMAHSPHAWVRLKAVWRATQIEQLQQFLDDPHGEIRADFLLKATNFSDDHPDWVNSIFERLVQDPERGIRISVARYLRDPDVIEQMSNDPDPEVLAQLEYNKFTSAETRERIRQRLGH